MTNKPNPYAPVKASHENRSVVANEGPAVLHRGLGTLVGSLNGGWLAAFFAFILLGIAIKSDVFTRFDIGGMYPELGVVFLLICALLGGILGGLVSGVARGRRLLLALAVASSTPVTWLVLNSLFGHNAKAAVFIAITLMLSSTGSTLICHWLIGSIVRKRRAVVESLQADSSASPGLFAAAILTLNMICSVAFLVTALNLAGRPAEHLAGMAAGAGIFGMLSGLHLLSTYPNRLRVGTLTTVVCVSVVLIWVSCKSMSESKENGCLGNDDNSERHLGRHSLIDVGCKK